MICSKQPALARVLVARLQEDGHDVDSVGAVQTAYLRERSPHVVVSDEWAAHVDAELDGVRFALILLSVHMERPVVDSTRRTVVLVERSASVEKIVRLIESLNNANGADTRSTPSSTTYLTRPDGSRRLASFLSARERQVLSELVRGADTATLARTLHITPNTARDHIQSVMTKMNAHSRVQLVSIAVRDRLVDPASGLWLFDAG